MPIRSVVDLLAEQPEEALVRMRDAAQGEVDRLTVEVKLIEQALARKSRRSNASGGRLTREQVLDVVKRADRKVTASDVHDLLAAEGVTASLNSVRNHLSRLVDKNGLLERTADGGYLPAAAAYFSPPGKDDDLPF